jgi:hypothetical protein
MPEDSTPILVGCGQVTDLVTPVDAARSPFDLMAEAGRLALARPNSEPRPIRPRASPSDWASTPFVTSIRTAAETCRSIW